MRQLSPSQNKMWREVAVDICRMVVHGNILFCDGDSCRMLVLAWTVPQVCVFSFIKMGHAKLPGWNHRTFFFIPFDLNMRVEFMLRSKGIKKKVRWFHPGSLAWPILIKEKTRPSNNPTMSTKQSKPKQACDNCRRRKIKCSRELLILRRRQLSHACFGLDCLVDIVGLLLGLY
jgi:hypothetical protein